MMILLLLLLLNKCCCRCSSSTTRTTGSTNSLFFYGKIGSGYVLRLRTLQVLDLPNFHFNQHIERAHQSISFLRVLSLSPGLHSHYL
jgi:hypothetical protein